MVAFLSVALRMSVEGSEVAVGTGGAPEDHFQPGASVFSSRRERSRDVEGEEGSLGVERSRRVIEKPGMFRLV